MAAEVRPIFPTPADSGGGAGRAVRPVLGGTAREPPDGATVQSLRLMAIRAGVGLSPVPCFDPEWIEIESRGRIFSWERVWHPSHAALRHHGPYVAVLVEIPQPAACE